MSTYDRLSELPLTVEGYSLEGLERDVSSDFTRLTTLIRLRGDGEEGVGEDVSYDPLDQIAFRDAGTPHDLTGEHTLDTFSARLDELELFPAEPAQPAARRYRRWAFESAALDLALRQAGRSLPELLGRDPRPLTFVVSLRLGEPPSLAPIEHRLALDPGLRFKLDPTSSWDEDLIAALVATGAVDTLDLKGAYKGSIVEQPPDPVLYERVAMAFPDAWIEDPDLEPAETDEVLRPHRDRITWDVPIHSVRDIEALPFPPRMVNVKPSRFGPLRELFAAYDHCAARGIGMYGGGQFELGPGRGHIQLLAALFHPDGPNDVAPGGWNDTAPGSGLATSPLAPPRPLAGFRWSAD